MNPGVKADQGVDKSAHDFLQSWVVEKQPNKSVAYFSRQSYPCLEATLQNTRQSAPQGMIRLRTLMAMQRFSDSVGTANSVADVFEPCRQMVAGIERGKERVCIGISAGERAGWTWNRTRDASPYRTTIRANRSKEKFFATAFRGKQGDSRNKVMTLLWAQEGDFWKIIAIRIEDSSDAGVVPKNAAGSGRTFGGRTAEHCR